VAGDRTAHERRLAVSAPDPSHRRDTGIGHVPCR